MQIGEGPVVSGKGNGAFVMGQGRGSERPPRDLLIVRQARGRQGKASMPKFLGGTSFSQNLPEPPFKDNPGAVRSKTG
jgi:hypothetical protein